mgnify:CR=1 FL=1
MKVRLLDIAHARSGDKGDDANVGVIALREAAPDGPFLVVCPAGVKLVWAREIRAIEPHAAERPAALRAGVGHDRDRGEHRGKYGRGSRLAAGAPR